MKYCKIVVLIIMIIPNLQAHWPLSRRQDSPQHQKQVRELQLQQARTALMELQLQVSDLLKDQEVKNRTTSKRRWLS